jgi:hypothetical protein
VGSSVQLSWPALSDSSFSRALVYGAQQLVHPGCNVSQQRRTLAVGAAARTAAREATFAM